jgi:hypothetical protein
MTGMTREEALKRLQSQFPDDPYWKSAGTSIAPSSEAAPETEGITGMDAAPYAAAAGAASGAFGAPKETIKTELRARDKAVGTKATISDLDREIRQQRALVDQKYGKGFFDLATERILTQRALGQMPNVPETFDPFLGRTDQTGTYARERQTGFGMGTKDVWKAAQEGDEAAQALIRSFQAGQIGADELARYSAPVKRILVDPLTQEAEIAARTARMTGEALDLSPGARAFTQRVDLTDALPTYRGSTSSALTPGIRVADVVAGSRPRSAMIGALGGLGAALSGEEALSRMKENDKIGATIAGVGALGDIAAMIPLSPVPSALAAKGTGIAVGALSPLMLMAYDKYKPQIDEFLAKRLGYTPSVMDR